MADDSESSSPLGGDGTVDRIWKRSPRAPVAAIFIHAGAGYHSTTNEKVHLDACAEYVPKATWEGKRLLT